MPVYWIFEIRSADEVVSVNKGLCGDMTEYIRLSNNFSLATHVDSIPEVIRRIMVYFLLCYFLQQSSIEFGFRYKKILEPVSYTHLRAHET